MTACSPFQHPALKGACLPGQLCALSGPAHVGGDPMAVLHQESPRAAAVFSHRQDGIPSCPLGMRFGAGDLLCPTRSLLSESKVRSELCKPRVSSTGTQHLLMDPRPAHKKTADGNTEHTIPPWWIRLRAGLEELPSSSGGFFLGGGSARN